VESGRRAHQGLSAGRDPRPSFSRFYPPEAIAAGRPAFGLQEAVAHGGFEDEGWRVRKDGSRFWASVTITAVRGRAASWSASSRSRAT
jgi:hypothetical protein